MRVVVCARLCDGALTPPPMSLRLAQPEKIKHLLDNIEAGTGKGSVMEKVEGMKYILAVSAWRGVGRCFMSFTSLNPHSRAPPPRTSSPTANGAGLRRIQVLP